MSASAQIPLKTPSIYAARALARTVPQAKIIENRTLGAVRVVRAPKKEKGIFKGTIERSEISP